MKFYTKNTINDFCRFLRLIGINVTLVLKRQFFTRDIIYAIAGKESNP